MSKIPVAWVAVLAASLGATAFAQTKGEADESQSRPAAVKKATDEEKLQARAKRKAEGAAVSKEGIVSDQPQSAGARQVRDKKAPSEAVLKRRADAKDAVKKGQIPSGEK